MTSILLPLFLTTLIAANSPTHPRPPSPAAQTTPHRPKARLPSLEQLIARAETRLGFSAKQMSRWQRRARLAGLLPTVSAGVDHRQDQGWQLDETLTQRPLVDLDRGTSQVTRVRAVWDLSRLIYSGDEVRIVQAQMDFADWHDSLAEKITELYGSAFGLVTAPPSTTAEQETQLRLELALLLAQLTIISGADLPSAEELRADAGEAKPRLPALKQSRSPSAPNPAAAQAATVRPKAEEALVGTVNPVPSRTPATSQNSPPFASDPPT